MTSIYQMAVLVQYNSADAFTYKELATATSLDETTLRGVLGTLTKAKVLNLVEEDGDENFELNYNFKSKKVSLSLPLFPLPALRNLTDLPPSLPSGWLAGPSQPQHAHQSRAKGRVCPASQGRRRGPKVHDPGDHRPCDEVEEDDEAQRPRQRGYRPGLVAIPAERRHDQKGPSSFSPL
jgi:hypothetical protein